MMHRNECTLNTERVSIDPMAHGNITYRLTLTSFQNTCSMSKSFGCMSQGTPFLGPTYFKVLIPPFRYVNILLI